MKYILQIYAFIVFCFMLPMHASNNNKAFIKIHNQVVKQEGDFVDSVGLTVTLKQEQKVVDKKGWVAGGAKKFFYYLDKGPVTVMIEGAEFGPYEVTHLQGKDLRINGEASWRKIRDKKTDKMVDRVVTTIEKIDFSYSTSLPQKQKRRGYKTVNRDQDWVVRVVDEQGTHISESTFKKNTDRFAKKLEFQLNPIPIKDTQDQKHKFNTNIIKVFKSKKPEEEPDIKSQPISAAMLKPGYQIEITDSSVRVVDKPQEPKE